MILNNLKKNNKNTDTIDPKNVKIKTGCLNHKKPTGYKTVRDQAGYITTYKY